MGSNETVFHANRLIALLLLLVMATATSAIFWPGAADLVQHAHLTGKLRMFDGWEPRHRMLLAYGLTGFFAATVIGAIRVLINNRMVTIGDLGIEVRQPLWFTRRAYWRDFVSIKKVPLVGNVTRLHFDRGFDVAGNKLARKITLPSPILVDNKAIVNEALARTIAGLNPAPKPQVNPATTAQPVSRVASGFATTPAARVFGKRRA